MTRGAAARGIRPQVEQLKLKDESIVYCTSLLLIQHSFRIHDSISTANSSIPRKQNYHSQIHLYSSESYILRSKDIKSQLKMKTIRNFNKGFFLSSKNTEQVMTTLLDILAYYPNRQLNISIHVWQTLSLTLALTSSIPKKFILLLNKRELIHTSPRTQTAG